MKIVIFTIGTQGDARPFVGFGQRLQSQGHEVVIATAERHEALIVGGGLKHAAIRSDFADMMAREHAAMDAGNQIRLGRQMAQALCEWMPTWVAQGMEATQDADLIMGSGSGTALGGSLAEKRGIPFAQTQFMPLTPSRSIPPLWPSPRFKLPGALNLALTHTTRTLVWRLLSAPTAIMRQELGLKPFPWHGPWSPRVAFAERRYLLYAFSKYLQPQPTDWPSETIAVTGNWFYDQAKDWNPPAALEQFLQSGPKPIYVGFGSMLSGDPKAFTRTVLEGIRQSGQRAIVATGWGALDREAESAQDNVLFIDGAPHDWLFPRVAMAVHHGGAGTVAAAARAGLAQVIIPFVADQFFWSWRLKTIGVSPVMLNRKTLTPTSLATAIQQALTSNTATVAARLAPLIEAENGIDTAIAQLHRWGLLHDGPGPVTLPPDPTGHAAPLEAVI